MDTQSIIFFVVFGVLGFIILYRSILAGAWSKYNKVDEKILDLKGEVVEATLISSKKNSKNKKLYDITVEYIDNFGVRQVAEPVTYQKIYKEELQFIKKNQPVRALAYKEIVEFDFSELDLSQVNLAEGSGSLIVQILRQLFPLFTKRCGFPPKHPRKQLLKELECNE